MAIPWAQECCDRYDDPISGARIVQITSSTAASNNVYGEQPYCSPDGERIAILRRFDTFDPTSMFLVGDIKNLRVGLIERALPQGVANNAWSGYLYYWTTDRDLKRTSLVTLETETVLHEDDPEQELGLGTISPDFTQMIYATYKTAPLVSIIRMDLTTGKREIIFQHPEITNPHLQYEPVYGKKLLVQHNRGSVLDPDGTVSRRVSAQGTTLFTLDADGSNQQQIPAGPPWTAACTGHECFVPGTDQVIFTTSWNFSPWSFDERFPYGNIFLARPGDATPTCFACPEHKTNHISMSRCGNYFVADSHLDGVFDKNHRFQPCALIIGNIKTGKYRTLVTDTNSAAGGNQLTHSHPYITTDNGAVIYNTDQFSGVPQVFAARIPPEFLASLG